MKIAISIPDALFRKAERIAKHMEVSRSELYAKALAAFLEGKGKGEITEALNKVYGARESSLDSVLQALQSASLPREEW